MLRKNKDFGMLDKYLNSKIYPDMGWAEEEEFCATLLEQADERDLPRKGGCLAIMSEPGKVWLAPEETHSMTAGGTGSGKTRDVFVPSILAALAGGQNIFVLDVKGEMEDYTRAAAEENRYQIVSVNLQDAFTSKDLYSPLYKARSFYRKKQYAQGDASVAAFADTLFKVPEGATKDLYWYNASAAAFKGVAMMLGRGPQTAFTLSRICTEVEACADFDYGKDLAHRVEAVCGKNSIALSNIKVLSDLHAENTRTCVVGAFTSTLAALTKNDGVRAMVDDPGAIDLAALAKLSDRPVIMYFHMGDEPGAADLLAQLFITDLYYELIAAADAREDRRHPQPWHLFIDEAGQIPLSGLPKWVAVCRSRRIYIHLAVQSLEQLTSLYGAAEAETLVSNCMALIVLRTQNEGTWNKISSLCGVDVFGQKLIQPFEVARLERGQALILMRGRRPFMSHVADFTTNPFYCRQAP